GGGSVSCGADPDSYRLVPSGVRRNAVHAERRGSRRRTEDSRAKHGRRRTARAGAERRQVASRRGRVSKRWSEGVKRSLVGCGWNESVGWRLGLGVALMTVGAVVTIA